MNSRYCSQLYGGKGVIRACADFLRQDDVQTKLNGCLFRKRIFVVTSIFIVCSSNSSKTDL